MKATRAMRGAVTATALVAGGACQSAPSQPTWAADVAPILAANCVRCHGDPAIGGAPSSFRLDRYDDFFSDDGRTVFGASTVAEFLTIRADDGSMPPRFPLDGYQAETLLNWWNSRQPVDLGDRTVPPPRGEPRPGNHLPELRILERSVVNDVVTLRYQLDDADGDLVSGGLRVGVDRPSATLRSTRLHTGRGVVTWHQGEMAPGSYQMFADLDDGSGETTIDVGAFTVARAGNAAPFVLLPAPLAHDIVADRDLPLTVLFEASDLDDGDVLTATVRAVDELRPQSAPLVIAANLAVPNPPLGQRGAAQFDLDSAAWPEGPSWRLEVEVSDGTTSTIARSPRFVVSHGTTTESWATIRPIFVAKCNTCHEIPRIPTVTHNFANYLNDGTDLGVYENRGLVYLRAVRQRNMPPTSHFIVTAEGKAADLTGEEVERLSSWLLAGAPEL